MIRPLRQLSKRYFLISECTSHKVVPSYSKFCFCWWMKMFVICWSVWCLICTITFLPHCLINGSLNPLDWHMWLCREQKRKSYLCLHWDTNFLVILPLLCYQHRRAKAMRNIRLVLDVEEMKNKLWLLFNIALVYVVHSYCYLSHSFCSSKVTLFVHWETHNYLHKHSII